jgi:O-methyltransferase
MKTVIKFIKKSAKSFFRTFGTFTLGRGDYILPAKAKRVLIYTAVDTLYGIVDLKRMARYQAHQSSSHPFLELYYQARALTKTSDFFAKESRLYTISELIQNHVFKNKIPGHFAECGCFRGHSSYVIATLLKQQSFQNTFWIFDSFEGISKKTPIDNKGEGAGVPQDFLKAPLENLKKVLEPFPFVSIHKGWIPEVFETAPIATEKFAFLHVDVDLYEPTKECLDYFFSKMSPGGVIFISNYNVSHWPGSIQAVDEFVANNRTAFFLKNQIEGCVIVK